MKKIVLFMFVFSFVFSNAQDKNLKEKYNNLKNNEEKIDFIFENIISKQIKDFNTLENKNEDLENQISQLKENQKQSTFSLLKKDTTNKGKEITSLKEEISEKKLEIAKLETDINTHKKTISELEKQIKEFEDEKLKEKEDLISFINFIIQQKSDILSDKILKSTLKNAKTHKLNTTLISELEEYIKINKLFISSKDLLNLPFNSKNIENKLNELYKYNIQSSFPGLLEEGETIIYLLSDYQNKCSELVKLFDDFTNFGVNESNIKESLNDESDEYKDYPYLLGIVNQTLENPNRKIPIHCD
jgi:chromosome segregation ATPase